MLRTTVYPIRNLHLKPTFWGVNRDFKDVINEIENLWEGNEKNSTSSDFKETDQAYFISVDIPGVNKSSMELQIEGDHILVNATRKNRFHEGEQNTRKISHTIHMPKYVDKDKVQAHCEDGVLYIALPKIEKVKPKKIEINEGPKNKTWNYLLSEKEKS